MTKSPIQKPAAGPKPNQDNADKAMARAAPPVSLDELFGKLGDPTTTEAELRPYFELDEDRSGPFQPRLKLDDAKVLVPPTPEGRARGDVLMASANWWSRMRRLVQFNLTMAGGYTGPVIVSEGDSWFQYPILVEDTIDHLLTRKYAIRSLDAAGDTLENMVESGEYIDALRQTGASVFLFSGGGNDVLGGGHLYDFLRDYDGMLTPAQHILPGFKALLDEAIANYDKIIRSVEKLPGDILILCHGYDWPLPNKGRWLGKPMERHGIKDAIFQRGIVAEMINRFNARLGQLLAGFANAQHLDLRGVVGDTLADWQDELHPTSTTFAKVADRFDKAIKKHRPQFQAPKTRSVPTGRPSLGAASAAGRARSRPSKPPASSGRKGLSLHVGLNEIDPAHYGPAVPLNACVADATAMRDLARNAGFTTLDVLLDKKGTREAVIGGIRTAAETLKSGDIFLYTYAGHGSQLPDFNDDEEDDRLDETWCLYDGMFLDDEAYELWATFREGVRVLAILDSCHSGSAIRAAPNFLTGSDNSDAEGRKARWLPTSLAASAFNRNADFYRKIGGRKSGDGAGRALDEAATRIVRPALNCSVRLISGCQDNQLSMDGFFNGRFTEELLRVWKGGRFAGDYTRFHKTIAEGMPPTQSPNHMFIGVPDAAFDAQKPFTI